MKLKRLTELTLAKQLTNNCRLQTRKHNSPIEAQATEVGARPNTKDNGLVRSSKGGRPQQNALNKPARARCHQSFVGPVCQTASKPSRVKHSITPDNVVTMICSLYLGIKLKLSPLTQRENMAVVMNIIELLISPLKAYVQKDRIPGSIIAALSA